MAKAAYIGIGKETRACPECGGSVIASAPTGGGLLCLDCMHQGPTSEFVTNTSVAGKVKKMYVGVDTQVPITQVKTNTYSFNVENIEKYFSVTNGNGLLGWHWEQNGLGVSFKPNNISIHSSTATITLKLKHTLPSGNGQYQLGGATEKNYDKVTVKIGSATIANGLSGPIGLGEKNIENSVLAEGLEIVLTYTKDSSNSAEGEYVSFYLALPDLTVTETVITGYETKPIARKVKKVYVGVNNVARPCYSGGELGPYGLAPNMSYWSNGLAGTNVGNYALFGGGAGRESTTGNFAIQDVVNAYDNSLVRSSPARLSMSVGSPTAASLGTHAFFIGGWRDGSTVSSKVDIYSNTLTRTSGTDLVNGGMNKLAATCNGRYIVAGGGYTLSYNWQIGMNVSTSQMITYAWDSTLVQNTPTTFAARKQQFQAASVGGYAIFGSGYRYDGQSSADIAQIVEAYGQDLTKVTLSSFDVPVYDYAAVSNGKHALFAGGRTSVSATFQTYKVNAYDTDLVKTTPAALSDSVSNFAGAGIGDYVMFIGGRLAQNDTYYKEKDIYDSTLTKISKTFPNYNFIEAENLAAANVGDYALFAGGIAHGLYSNSVVAYMA